MGDQGNDGELGEIRRKLAHHRVAPSRAPRQKSTVGPASHDLTAHEIEALLRRGKAIYGADTRADVTEATTSLAGAVCVLFTADRLARVGDSYQLLTTPLTEAFNLCPDQRFGDQPCLGFGTGFLVRQDIVVTAGHCIKDVPDYRSIRLLFDFELDSGDLRLTRSSSEIYTIRKLWKCVVDPATGADYAIVQLDRAVPGVVPLAISTSIVGVNDEVYVIGHPLGLPKKIARNATVSKADNDVCFAANLDTFKGNSGSPVFNGEHQICGVLVRGAQDFIAKGDCVVVATFPLSPGGEDVCRATHWSQHVGSDKLTGLAEVKGSGVAREFEALREFLSTSFNSTELELLIGLTPYLSSIVGAVVFSGDHDAVVNSVIVRLFENELTGPELFDALVASRPGRAQQIAELRRLFARRWLTRVDP